MSKATHAAVLIAVAVLATACATTQAKMPVDHPPLEAPPVPARVIEAVPSPPPMPEPVADLPAAPANSRQKPAGPPRDTSKPDPKVETPPVEPPPPPVITPPAQPIAPLRTAGSPDAAQATRQIREIKDRAQKMLDTTDYRALNAEQRAQYDTAKRFISDVEDGIKASNFEFARGVAEKAERLARELQGR
jgi:hypothetical protein